MLHFSLVYVAESRWWSITIAWKACLIFSLSSIPSSLASSSNCCCGWPFYALSLRLSWFIIWINFNQQFFCLCFLMSLPLFAFTVPRVQRHKEFKYATCTMLADGAKDKSSKRPQTCNGLYEIAEHCADKLWLICIMKWKIAYLFKLLLLIFAHSRGRFRSSSLGNFFNFSLLSLNSLCLCFCLFAQFN